MFFYTTNHYFAQTIADIASRHYSFENMVMSCMRPSALAHPYSPSRASGSKQGLSNRYFRMDFFDVYQLF